MAGFRPMSLKIELPKVEEVDWTVDSILAKYYPDDLKLQENIKKLSESATPVSKETEDFVIETTSKNKASNTKIIVPRGITLPTYGAYDNEIKCSVWGKEYGDGDGRWIKIYRTAAYAEFVEIAWLTEIYFQNLARTLNSGCVFTSPAVLEYGTFSSSMGTFFYIIMEHVPEFSGKMSESNCVSIAKSVFDADTCLQENGLFHNDLRPANVFNRDGEVVIIDYGEADNVERNLDSERNEKSFIESCSKLRESDTDKLALDRQLLEANPITPSPTNKGGGTTRRKRNKTQRKRNKTQRKHRRNNTKRRHKK